MNKYLIKIKKVIKNRFEQNEIINFNLELEANDKNEIKNKILQNIKLNENDELEIIKITKVVKVR